MCTERGVFPLVEMEFEGQGAEEGARFQVLSEDDVKALAARMVGDLRA